MSQNNKDKNNGNNGNNGNDKNKPYKLMVNNVPYDYADQFITGAQIRELAGLDDDSALWFKVNGPDPDRPIPDDETVDLDVPGRPHYYSGLRNVNQG